MSKFQILWNYTRKKNGEIVIAEEELQKMLDMAERYYQLVKEDKENSEEAINVKNELDAIEAEFSDDPAYVALLKAERNSQ